MPLTDVQIQALKKAMDAYNYPPELYDFAHKKPLMFKSMRELEHKIRDYLLSNNPAQVRFALANVVYWGFASTGLAYVRSKRFLEEIKEDHIENAMKLFSRISGNSLKDIKDIRLPQFSQMSFTSKLRMFLDPSNYVVLDSQLLKLKDSKTKTLFQEIQRYPTSIPISRVNCKQYDKWCTICKDTANRYYSNTGVIAVDVERGIFHIINQNNLEEAAKLVSSMEY